MTPTWREWFPTWEMEALSSENRVLLHRYLQGLGVGACLSHETDAGSPSTPSASTAEETRTCLTWCLGGYVVSCLQKELLSEGIKTCFQCTTIIEVVTVSPFLRLLRDSDNLTLHKCHSGENLKGKNLWETFIMQTSKKYLMHWNEYMTKITLGTCLSLNSHSKLHPQSLWSH